MPASSFAPICRKGALIDMQDQRDLTTPLINKMHAIPFADLPLKLAIEEVHGHLQRSKLPLLPCVHQVPGPGGRRHDLPLHVPGHRSEVRGACAHWCAGDRAKAWKHIINGARPSQDGSCDVTGLFDNPPLRDKHPIQNTPALVLANGKRLVGATPPEQFLAALDAGGKCA